MRWRTVVVWLLHITVAAGDKLPTTYDLLGGYLPPSNSFGDSEPRDSFQGLSFGLPSFSDSDTDGDNLPSEGDDSEESSTDFSGASFESLRLSPVTPKEESQKSHSSAVPDDSTDIDDKFPTPAFIYETPTASFERPKSSHKFPKSTNDSPEEPSEQIVHKSHEGICIIANPYVQQGPKQTQNLPVESTRTKEIQQTYVPPQEAYIPPDKTRKVLKIESTPSAKSGEEIQQIEQIYSGPDSIGLTQEIRQRPVSAGSVDIGQNYQTPEQTYGPPTQIYSPPTKTEPLPEVEQIYELPATTYITPNKPTDAGNYAKSIQSFNEPDNEREADPTFSEPTSSYELPRLAPTHKSSQTSQDVFQVPELLEEYGLRIKQSGSGEREEPTERKTGPKLSLFDDSIKDSSEEPEDNDLTRGFFSLPSHVGSSRENPNKQYETPDSSHGEGDSQASLFFQIPTPDRTKPNQREQQDRFFSSRPSGISKISQPTHEERESFRGSGKVNFRAPKDAYVTPEKEYSDSSESVPTDANPGLGPAFFRTPQLSFKFPKPQHKNTNRFSGDDNRSLTDLNKDSSELDDELSKSTATFSGLPFSVGRVSHNFGDDSIADDSFGDDSDDKSDGRFSFGAAKFDGTLKAKDRVDAGKYKGSGRDDEFDDDDDGSKDNGANRDNDNRDEDDGDEDTAANFFSVPRRNYEAPQSTYRTQSPRLDGSEEDSRALSKFPKVKLTPIYNKPVTKHSKSKSIISQQSATPKTQQLFSNEGRVSKFPTVASTSNPTGTHRFFETPTLSFGKVKSIGESAIKPNRKHISVFESKTESLEQDHEENTRILPGRFSNSKQTPAEILNTQTNEISRNGIEFNPGASIGPAYSRTQTQHSPFRKASDKSPDKPARRISAHFSLNSKGASQEDSRFLKSQNIYSKDTSSGIKPFHSALSIEESKFDDNTDPTNLNNKYSVPHSSPFSRTKITPSPKERDFSNERDGSQKIIRTHSSSSKKPLQTSKSDHFSINKKHTSEEENELPAPKKQLFSVPVSLPARGTKSSHFSINVKQSSEENPIPLKHRTDYVSSTNVGKSVISKQESGEYDSKRVPQSARGFASPLNIRKPLKDTAEKSEEIASTSFFKIPQITYGPSKSKGSDDTEIRKTNKLSSVYKSPTQNRFQNPSTQDSSDEGLEGIFQSPQNRLHTPNFQDRSEEEQAGTFLSQQNRFLSSKKTSHDRTNDDPDGTLKSKPQYKTRPHQLSDPEKAFEDSNEVPSFFKIPEVHNQKQDGSPKLHRQGSFISPQSSHASPNVGDKKLSQSPAQQKSQTTGASGKMMNPYNFEWNVNDAKTGNDFGQKAVSDGMVERGKYHVLLPDGRKQVVTYLADWEEGFFVDVTYEGGEPPFPNNVKRVRRSPLYIL